MWNRIPMEKLQWREFIKQFVFENKSASFFQKGLPDDAIIIGADKDNNFAYAGRAGYAGGQQVGKFIPRWGRFYFGFYGKEIDVGSGFDVLCGNVKVY
jgi:Protein of unknown function (DUF3421)